VLNTFSAEGLAVPGRAPRRLPEAMAKLRENEVKVATWMPIALASVAIRWASEQTGRDEIEILDELAADLGRERRGFRPGTNLGDGPHIRANEGIKHVGLFRPPP